MTALNSLEILKKFFGNNTPAGFSLEMVRNGLFEEQLKLASQMGQTSPKEPQRDASLPMIKKTLPVGPVVPAQAPEEPRASRREEPSGADSASPAPNAASSPSPGASEEASSPSEGPRVSPADAPPAGQNQVPTSGESQTADQNESPELPTLVFSEDSSGASAEEESAGLPASALLTEISQEESKSEEPLDQTSPAVAAGEGASPAVAAGEGALLMVGSVQALPPSESAPAEDRSPTEQASSAPPVEPPGQHSGTSPKNLVPGPLPGEPHQGREAFSEGQNMPHLLRSGSEQTGQSAGAGGDARANGSGQAIPPGMNPLPGTPQGMAVSAPSAAAPAGLLAERAASGGSGGVSAAGAESLSRVGQTTERSGTVSSVANPTKAKAAADPEASSQEAGVQRVRFVQRVARAFQSLQDGGGSVRLRLHPPELGALRVELTVREGVMRARMEVENSTARTAILEHLPMLRERLAQQDIRIEQFEVEIGGQTNGGASQHSDNPAAEQRNASFSPPTNRSRPAEANPATSRGNPLTASESTKLNVVI